MHTVVGEVDYVLGQIHSGHYETVMSDHEFAEFQKMSEENQKKYIKKHGKLIIDSYNINDIGDIVDIS